MSSTKNLIHDPDDQFNATYFVEYFLSDKCLIFFGVGKFIKVISKKTQFGMLPESYFGVYRGLSSSLAIDCQKSLVSSENFPKPIS